MRYTNQRILYFTRLQAMLILSPDQQSGIHCQMIRRIQWLTLNIYGKTSNQIYSLDTLRSVSALGMFYIIVFYKSTHTYLLVSVSWVAMTTRRDDNNHR